MSVPEARRLRELETENGRLKLLAESLLEIKVTREALRKMVTAPAGASWCGIGRIAA